jgi:hypothetical protein
MTINAYCSPTAERRKEHGHEGCPGTVYKYRSDIAATIVRKEIYSALENRTLVLCSCPCHSKKEAR